MANVVDIRGRTARPETRPVLVDPSGLRARWLARSARAVALVFVLWLAGLGLADPVVSSATGWMDRTHRGTSMLAESDAIERDFRQGDRGQAHPRLGVVPRLVHL